MQICQAEITLRCLARNTTIQLFAGDEPLTSPFPVTTEDTQVTLQAIITANTLPGNTITIQNDSVFPLVCNFGQPQGSLHLVVEVFTETEITGNITFTDSDEGFGNFSTVPFVCSIVPPPPTPKKHGRRVGVFKPYIYIPVNDLPYIGRWNVSCKDSGSNICCYAWSGTIVGSVQCVSYRKTNSQYIQDAIAEAQARTPYPVIQPIEAGNTEYYYDGVENDFYRFRHPSIPSALRPGSILIGR